MAVAGCPPARDDQAITRLADTARFRADDPQELVAASLLCPVCLRDAAADRDLDTEGYDPSVLCHCDHCGQSWRVYLTDQQALRLALTVA
jgi:hypothetical protein